MKNLRYTYLSFIASCLFFVSTVIFLFTDKTLDSGFVIGMIGILISFLIYFIDFYVYKKHHKEIKALRFIFLILFAVSLGFILYKT